MPGSWTTPGRPGARADAPVRVAFHGGNHVGARIYQTFAARWLACTLPCRRFASALAGTDARLGADVDRYSFIVMDSHHLLLAGLSGALPRFGMLPRSIAAVRNGRPSYPIRRALATAAFMHQTSLLCLFLLHATRCAADEIGGAALETGTVPAAR